MGETTCSAVPEIIIVLGGGIDQVVDATIGGEGFGFIVIVMIAFVMLNFF